jgi:hypothetical protein
LLGIFFSCRTVHPEGPFSAADGRQQTGLSGGAHLDGMS